MTKKVSEMNAITLNVRAQDQKIEQMDRLDAKVNTMRIDLAKIIFKEVDKNLDKMDTNEDRETERERLMDYAKGVISDDGYKIKHEKNLWSTVRNVLNLLLWPDAEFDVENKIVDGKMTYKKAKASEVVEMTPRKINNSAAAFKRSIGTSDARNDNTPPSAPPSSNAGDNKPSDDKPEEKQTRQTRLPETGKGGAQPFSWETALDALFDKKTVTSKNGAAAIASFVKASVKHRNNIELAFNAAGYLWKIESVVPEVAKKAAAKAATTTKQPSTAAVKKAAAAKAAAAAAKGGAKK